MGFAKTKPKATKAATLECWCMLIRITGTYRAEELKQLIITIERNGLTGIGRGNRHERSLRDVNNRCFLDSGTNVSISHKNT